MRKRIIELTGDAKKLLRWKHGQRVRCPSCKFEGTYDTNKNQQFFDSIWYNSNPEENRFECVRCWLKVEPLDKTIRWFNINMRTDYESKQKTDRNTGR